VFSGKEVTYQAWNGIPEPRVKNDIPGMIEYAALLGTDLDHLLKSGNRTYNEFTYKNQVDNYQQDHYQLFYTYLPNKYLKLNIGTHYTYGRGYYEEFKPGERLSKYKLNDIIIGNDTVRRSDIIRRRWLDNDFYGVVFSAIYEKNKLTATFGGGANVYEGRHFGEMVWSQYASNSFLGTRFYDGNSIKKEVNFYGKANYQFTDKFSSFVDLQVRSINYDLKGVDLNGSNYNPYDFNLNYLFFNPKAGLSYAFNQRTNVYAYFGIANREPERKDIIQAPVNNVPTSERLFNYELGFRKRMNKFSVEANAYYMDYQNQLVNTGQVNDVGAYNRVNVASSYRAGIELAGGVQLLKKLRWQATLTYSQNRIYHFTEYIDDWDNGTQITEIHHQKKIGFSPDWIASSVLSYTPVKQLQVDLITKYVSEQYLDNTENDKRKLDAFLVNDIRINYDLPITFMFNSIRLGVLINNILDVNYEPNGYTFSGITGGRRYDFNYYYPQAGTNILANLILRF
jgi:iron complex outermembrane receptor protein